MRVADILNEKGTAVSTVKAEDPMTSAVCALGEKNIGALVVVNDEGAVNGILSERDIVRHLAEKGADALAGKVSDCMTAEVFTCDKDDTVDSLMSMMTERRIRHLPVIEAGGLAGIVSIGDVVKRRIRETEQEAEALKSYIAG
ncbi:MAG: CBS domain-containing protein [Pseudomonadota bacterium]